MTFKEWKYCQHELNILRHMDWMKCPACNDFQHSVHVDGNMKLYRFKSAGSWVLYKLFVVALVSSWTVLRFFFHFPITFNRWSFMFIHFEIWQWYVCLLDDNYISLFYYFLHFLGSKQVFNLVHFIYSLLSFFRRQRECYYGDTFIASNKEVDKHIQKVYNGSKHSVRILCNLALI